jgi:uncharacterized protein DUF3105
MASRQEEKEARRRARLEQEERERKAAARSKRLQFVIGGVLAAGIVAAVVVALFASGGDEHDPGTAPTNASASTDVKLPEPAIQDEQQAADAAGCTVEQVPNEGRGHEEREFTVDDYDQNPPTSGTHFPAYAQDGTYASGQTPPLGELVHTLEHGRIDVQYKPGTPQQWVDKLQAFLDEKQGYHLLLYENTTDMQPQIAATAWDHVLRCPKPNDKMFDALRTFYDAHVDRGPEKVA